MSLIFNFPPGVQEYQDIYGVRHEPDANGQITLSDVGQLSTYEAAGFTIVTQGPRETQGTLDTPYVVTSTGTTNLSETAAQMTAPSGTLRGTVSELDYAGVNIGAALFGVASRGYANVTGTLAGGSTNYIAGAQGKAKISGTMTGGRVAGVLAQIDTKGGSAAVSGGEIAGLWIDNQYGAAVGGGNTMAMIHGETSDAAICTDSFIHTYGRMSQFINFAGAFQDYVTADATAFSGLTGSFKIKCLVNGVPAYIHMTTA